MGGWFRKQITKMDDLKGLKFRLGGFAGKIMQRVGVVPQQIAGGDIYPALEKGTIDGAEWVGPYDDEKLGFVQGGEVLPLSRLVGAELDQRLHRQPRQVQQPAASSTRKRSSRPRWRPTTGLRRNTMPVNTAALKRLASQGTVLQPFSQEVMDGCYKAAKELYAELNAKNPAFKKIYDSYTAFMADGYLWHQVADYTMDSYMIRYRNQKT